MLGTEAYADGLPDNQAKWLKEVGSKFKGAKIRYTTEATPPSVVLNQIKKEFTDPTGIEVEVEIVPLEQVLAKATQDVQGQLGTYDLYYLDQSWIATFAPGLRRSGGRTTRTSPNWRCPISIGTTSPSPWSTMSPWSTAMDGHPVRYPDLHPDVPQGHPGEAQDRGADHLRGFHWPPPS